MELSFYCENTPDCGKGITDKDTFIKAINHWNKKNVRSFVISCSWECLVKIAEVQSGQVISRTIRRQDKDPA
jgi:hypothetical protein